MLVFANNCFSGFLYKQLNTEFNHPLFWGGFYLDNHPEFYYHFIKEFYNINFTDYKIETEKDEYTINQFKKWHKDTSYPVYSFEGWKYRFTHYVYDANADIPLRKGMDIKYKHIFNYANEKFQKRLSKFPKNETPVFIVHFNDDKPADNEIVKKFCMLKNRKLIIVCRHKENYETAQKYKNDQLLVLTHPSGEQIPDICIRHLETIKAFI